MRDPSWIFHDSLKGCYLMHVPECLLSVLSVATVADVSLEMESANIN